MRRARSVQNLLTAKIAEKSRKGRKEKAETQDFLSAARSAVRLDGDSANFVQV